MNYKGSCHCGRISFEVEGQIEGAMACNCSICQRKGSLLWPVPREKLHLLTPEAAASTYTFHKHVIKHRFCPNCGMNPYSEGTDPKGNAMAAINIRSPTRSDEGDIMASDRAMPKTIDEYIEAFPPEVQSILQKIRLVIRGAAPDAQETISYQIPAFKLNGTLVYFAAFKKHIGFYPPITGDARLEKAVARYAGEKGNLRFPLDEPIPYDLIERITNWRVKQNLAKAAAKSK